MIQNLKKRWNSIGKEEEIPLISRITGAELTKPRSERDLKARGNHRWKETHEDVDEETYAVAENFVGLEE